MTAPGYPLMEQFKVLSTTGLGIGLIHTSCKLTGEASDLTSGLFRDEYTLAELAAMANVHHLGEAGL